MPAKQPLTTREIVKALRSAIKGLIYMSETDAPFEVVHWPGKGQPLTPGRLLELTGQPPNAAVKTLPLEAFFKELTRAQDWHGPEERAEVKQYRRLLDLLQSRLGGAQAFRIGEVNIDIYLVGQTPEGDWIGVKTSAVET